MGMIQYAVDKYDKHIGEVELRNCIKTKRILLLFHEDAFMGWLRFNLFSIEKSRLATPGDQFPLEIWQVDAICQILGLSVNLSDLNRYEMSSKDRVIKRMEIYNNSIKSMISKNREKEK